MIQVLAGNIIELFLIIQKSLAEPYRFHYIQLRRLLYPLLTEEEINELVRSFFNKVDSTGLAGKKGLFSVSSNVRIVALSRKIGKELDVSMKITFITVLLKLISKCKGKDAAIPSANVKVISDLLEIPRNVYYSLVNLTENDFIVQDDYVDSISVSSTAPDYSEVLLGLKHYHIPRIGFSFCLKYFKEFDFFIAKIFKVYNTNAVNFFDAGDILVSGNHINSILSKAGLSPEGLKMLLSAGSGLPDRVEIPGTETTPLVVLDAVKFKIEITGPSIPLTPLKFFEPVIKWIDIVKEKKPSKIEIHLNLNYFNTYTSKVILEIFLKLKNLELMNCDAHFIWYHESDDLEIKEAGEYYAEILNKEFEIVELQTD